MEVESGLDSKGSCKPSRALRKFGGDKVWQTLSSCQLRRTASEGVFQSFQLIRDGISNSLLFFCLWDGLQFV